MNRRPRRTLLATALVVAAAAPAAVAVPAGTSPVLAPVGTYSTGLAGPDRTAAETVAVAGDRMFVTNTTGNSLDIVDISDVAAPVRIARVDLAPYGAGPNSVDVHGDLVAVAMEAAPKTAPGAVVFLRTDGTHVATVPAGALPDMLAFDDAGRTLLVANEGEPNGYGRADSVDPPGSLTVIDVDHLRGRSGRAPRVRIIDFTAFDVAAPRNGELPAGIRLKAGARVSDDLEPEYVAFDHTGGRAWVTLQEANAIAEVDVRRARVVRIRALGTLDHSLAGNGIDASDRDGAVTITPRPVRGMFMPDAVATFHLRGRTYLVTANEGDARDYTGYSDEARVGGRTLDPTAFPNAAALKANAGLGRLNISTVDGVDASGAHTGLFSFGTRSATVWTPGGARVWDSGDAFEQTVAATPGAVFNASNDDNTFDSRSDNKGPEPEGVATGRIDGRTYAFVGLERAGGVMVVDVTDPAEARVVQWANTRVFTADPRATDSGPEIVRFVPGRHGTRPRVVVSNEVSGTVTVYEATAR